MSRIEDLHDSVFTPESYKERYKYGAFRTEGVHVAKLIKLVVDMLDQNKTLTLYDPCAGTGILEVELLSQLTSKYGVDIAKKIATRRLKLADIDSKMREVCKEVLFLHTKDLFGEGIHFNIAANNLETDSFDLSKMIVYGNMPFNKGHDYNYLAKIFRQQMKCELSLGVFMGAASVFDPHKIQSSRILGKNFYTWMNKEYIINDFEEVAVKISAITFDKSRLSESQNVDELYNSRFTTLAKVVDKFLYRKKEKFTGLVIHQFPTIDKPAIIYYLVEASPTIFNNTSLVASPKILSYIGLIFTSTYFNVNLIENFSYAFRASRYIGLQRLKAIPIPKNIPDRLYEIGDILIIQGKEDVELRKEADDIIEKLYENLAK
ncbi:hypothetical protein LCGC14_1354990 [marine sediment metagenome]|uniref:DNA methylase adenine-specific domain-containing protein n=1 Tax=marine sediment metagenome TaxID=412755 RepID=A0A0F9MQA2_9ZZZZ